MSTTSTADHEQILQAALKLTAGERAELAERLWQSLDDKTAQPLAEDIREAWVQEALQRLEDYRAGREVAISEEEVMAQIREWVAIKNDLALKTPYDAKLGTCTACLCDLRTKIWVPLNIVLKVTTPEVREKLHPACWIKMESETTSKAA